MRRHHAEREFQAHDRLCYGLVLATNDPGTTNALAGRVQNFAGAQRSQGPELADTAGLTAGKIGR